MNVTSDENEQITKIDEEEVRIEPSNKENQQGTEGVWCWVVCFAAFCIILIRNGLLVSFGVIFPDILQEFQQTKSKTAWVGSIADFFAYLFGPVASTLSKRFGHHTVIISGGILCSIGLILTSFATKLEYMCLSFGIITGIGCCLSYIPVHVVLSSCFHKNRSLAMSIAASGFNTGMFTMGPLVSYLTQLYGWRITYRILAIQGLLIVILAMTFRPSKCFPHKQTKEKPSLSEMLKLGFAKDVFKDRKFIALLCATTAAGFGIFVPKTFLMKYASEIGLKPSKSSQLYIYIGVSAIIGKFFIAVASRTGKIRNSLLCQITLFVSGLTAILSSLTSSYKTLVLFAVFYGSSNGAYGGIISVTTFEVVGHEKMNHAWGTMSGLRSFGYLLGPPLAGLFIDIYKTSLPMFYVTGFFVILGSLFLLYIICTPPRDPEQIPLIINRTDSNDNKDEQ